MIYVIYQEDRPGAGNVRNANQAAHLSYLDLHRDKVVLGGALLADDGEQRLGSCLIINVKTRKEAEAFSRGEPFRKAGLFETVKIRRLRRGHWNPGALPFTETDE